jgi:hypothetical protein
MEIAAIQFPFAFFPSNGVKGWALIAWGSKSAFFATGK